MFIKTDDTNNRAMVKICCNGSGNYASGDFMESSIINACEFEVGKHIFTEGEHDTQTLYRQLKADRGCQ